jgi:hypothetical protein
MTEFIAAMALFIPLIMGVVYIGKYGDIKHQAIQASRYAAMERALDPHNHESDSVIQNETVARFFRDGGQHDIARNEQATGQTAGDENANWTTLAGDPMLSQYSDVSVKLSSKSIDSDLLKPVEVVTDHVLDHLNSGYGVEADVEVPVANISHFLPLSGINLRIGASTVMAGDPWSAGSAQDVVDHLTPLAVPARAMHILNQIPGIDFLFKFLVDTPGDTALPQFGCVKPDVVPEAATNGAHYDPTDGPISPSNPNNKCY